jgi:hypothetical protein
MTAFYSVNRCNLLGLPIFLLFLFFANNTVAQQQLRIRDFVLFGGDGSCPSPIQTLPSAPGCGVQLATSTTVVSGAVGSYKLIRTTGNSSFSGNVHSGGLVELSNSNTIYGNLTVGNSGGSTGNSLFMGSNAFVTGNILVNGNTMIGGGTIQGSVTYPPTASYSGPEPLGGRIPLAPELPLMPVLPGITAFPDYGTTPVINTQIITPTLSPFGNMALPGNKTITFRGTGTYVFQSIRNSGNTNKFVFDFDGDPTGVFRIFVHGDVELYKLNVEIRGGGSASRIYMEVHGSGATSPEGNFAWSMSNGASGNNQSIWYGTVWAPYAGIRVGSGSSASKVVGALWSGTQVNIESGVSITHEAYVGCQQTNAQAGPDKILDCNTPTVPLSGSSSSVGVQYNWTTLNGGTISSGANTLSPQVSSAGTYVLHVSSPGCGEGATDTVVVTFVPCIIPLNPPPTDGKVYDKIGSELNSLYNHSSSITDVAQSVLVIRNGYVLIDVIANVDYYQDLKLLLITTPYGMIDTVYNGVNTLTITGYFPIANLLMLNNLGLMVNHVRPVFAPLGNQGLTQSQGDRSIGADLVRNGYNLDGTGVKIGVISDSYNTISGNPANDDVLNGDLPGVGNPNGNLTPVQMRGELPRLGTDEGRAMLQIVHDLAPKSELAFRTGFISAGDFSEAILDLYRQNCKVIVDDVTYITESFFKDGRVARAVDYVKSQGVSYFTAAGNFGSRSYENLFLGATAPAGITGTAHNFGGGDIYQNVLLRPGIYTIVLQWEDDIYSLGETVDGGTNNDLDIYITDNSGRILFGFNRDNRGGDPLEILSFSVSSAVTSVAANIMVVKANTNTDNIRFKYVIFRGEGDILEHNTGSSTITGQGNALGAITVGAVLYSNAPAFGGTPSVSSFSSKGGTTVYNAVRNKPDICAPNGVNTTVTMGPDFDGDGYSNFLGTSASAPHAAAVAALLIQGKMKFTGQNLSPDQLKALLKLTALDIGPAGFDFTAGSGLVQADSAMRTFAAPTPEATALVYNTLIIPGTTRFELRVTGKYLSYRTKIYFRGLPLETTVIGTTEARAYIDPFIGNPAIQLYTPPINTIDGGLSNSLYFFSPVKKNITVIADFQTKKYGEALPAFTTTILVNGDSLHKTNLTREQLGLQNITFFTPATATSDVGNYLLRAIRTFSTSDPVDIGLLEQYNYVFRDSVIRVDKLPITVTPRDTSLMYGEAIGNIRFNYTYDQSLNIANPGALFNSIRSSHENLLANDVVGLINGQAVTIINGQAVPIINGQAVTIINGQAVTIINGQAVPIINAQSITIINGQAVPIINNLTEAEVDDMNLLVSEESLLNARQLAAQTLVNGQFVPQTMNVVDITQESILKYNVNPSIVSLTSSVSNVHQRGVAGSASLLNGQAVTIINGQSVPIINGQSVPIINGQAVTIINGQAVTIINGQAVTIINGQAVPIINSLLDPNKNTGVIIDQNDVDDGTGPGTLRALNLLTGLGVGNQMIIPGVLLDNNLEVSYNVGHLTVRPIPLTIRARDTSKVYGETMNFNPLGYSITGTMIPGESIQTVGLTSTGASATANAGTYPIIPTASGAPGTDLSNYSITYLPGTLTVGKKLITVSAPVTSRPYGDPNPAFVPQYNGFVNGQTFATSGITGTPSLTSTATPGSNIGVYPITAATGTLASANYSFAFVPGSITISAVPLSVKANDYVIFQGDVLRTTAFTSTITGLKNGDQATVPSYTVNPEYLGAAGVYTIIPGALTFTKSINYVITYSNGILYVNPKGNGAKKLRPSLDCVEEVPGAPAGRQFIAHFSCINDNATPVFVKIGADNEMSSATGLFDASAQLEVFLPGVSRFNVPFDGTKLIWTLKTYETNKKTSTATNASSTSSRCPTLITRTVAIEPENQQAGSLRAYPNPARNSIRVETVSPMEMNSAIVILDAQGKTHPAQILKRIGGQSVEMNVIMLKPGVYFVRLPVAGGFETVKFIKL